MVEFIVGGETSDVSVERCDVPEAPYKIEAFALVIFGGAGDLAQRKLVPTVHQIFERGELPENFAIVGVGLPPMSDNAYRDLMRAALDRFAGGPLDEGRWRSFSEHLHYVGGGFDDAGTYRDLKELLSQVGQPCREHAIYYLAVPPTVIGVVVGHLNESGLCRRGELTKIIVEKPFGRDRASAESLNRTLTAAFEERQVYRIDHYLGKETVQNIIFLRFSNPIFERLWNSQHVEQVQITVAEKIGIEHRGSFYEQAGVVRDIVQNHMLQLLALVAMEPPAGFEADRIRDEKVKVFRSIRTLRGADIDAFSVRGQYGPGSAGEAAARGYREEDQVAPDSATPTFIAARLEVANWRWAGVPFYVRAGKRLARRVTEICIQFRQPPLRLFGRTCDELEPNLLVLTIQPEERIALRFGVKHPEAANRIAHVEFDFNYRQVFGEKAAPPYERLLVDCMKGDLTLFVRQDGVEAMWDAVDPLLERWEHSPPPGFPNYAAGSWGPAASDALLARDGRSWLTR